MTSHKFHNHYDDKFLLLYDTFKGIQDKHYKSLSDKGLASKVNYEELTQYYAENGNDVKQTEKVVANVIKKRAQLQWGIHNDTTTSSLFKRNPLFFIEAILMDRSKRRHVEYEWEWMVCGLNMNAVKKLVTYTQQKMIDDEEQWKEKVERLTATAMHEAMGMVRMRNPENHSFISMYAPPSMSRTYMRSFLQPIWPERKDRSSIFDRHETFDIAIHHDMLPWENKRIHSATDKSSIAFLLCAAHLLEDYYIHAIRYLVFVGFDDKLQRTICFFFSENRLLRLENRLFFISKKEYEEYIHAHHVDAFRPYPSSY